MSLADQARLSELHRASQTQLQALVASDVARVFPLLDANNVDATFAGYNQAMSAVINGRRRISASLGSSYYQQLRKAAGEVDEFLPVLSATADPEQLFTSLLVTGPISIKNNLRAGASIEQARNAALTQTVRSAQRHVINGGRETILSSVKRDSAAFGWARLTDGKPCAFCALLASRGPAYKSETTAKFKSHDGCGCTPVPVFDPQAPWPGDGQKYRDLYDEKIAGKYSSGSRSGQPGQLAGRDGNEALKQWRKVYESEFKVGNAAPSLPTVDLAPEAPKPDWRSQWEEAAQRVPEDKKSIGRVGSRSFTPDEAKAFQAATDQDAYVSDWIGRYNSAVKKNPGAVDGLKAEFEKVTGVKLEGNYFQFDVQRVQRDAQRTAAKLANDVRGAADIVDGLPGATTNSTLDAIIDAGKSLGDELDNRIAARIAAEGAQDLSAPAREAREAVEKKLAEATRKLEAAREKINIEAIRRVDAGEYTFTTGTREDHIKSVKSILEYRDKTVKTLQTRVRTLTSEQRVAVRLEETLRTSTLAPGTPQYAQIQREETIKILQEVRQMGGAGPTYTRGSANAVIKSGELIDAQEFAHSSYPSSWMERVRDAFPKVDLGSSARGYNAGGKKIRLSKGKIQILGDKGFHSVAVHELGHSMESAIDGLKEMEWAYHARRGSVLDSTGKLVMERPQWMGGAYRRDEISVFDSWREKYTGKVYGQGPGANYEVFTTGIESLMAGSKYLDASGALAYDLEFRNWLLGVLSVL